MADNARLMKTHFPVVLAACALLGAFTSVQAKPKAKMMAATFSESDKKFLTDDAQGSVYDFSLAQLAANRATSPELHRYGLQLISDHARLNQRLLTLGRTKGIALPITLSDEDKTKLDGLMTKTGSALDRALIAQFVEVNAQDVEDGQKELATTKDAATRRAVTEFVRTEKKHLREAQKMQNSFGVVGPR